MVTANLAVSTAFPEVLGELPLFSDQAAIFNQTRLAFPRIFRTEEDDLALLVRQNDQVLWATLGKWDL
jgi:hypothetical protein